MPGLLTWYPVIPPASKTSASFISGKVPFDRLPFIDALVDEVEAAGDAGSFGSRGFIATRFHSTYQVAIFAFTFPVIWKLF